MKTYTFHVGLPGHGRMWRKVELTAEQTLADLHLAIQQAFAFYNDHLFSFFMSGRAWDTASEYCLPEGMGPWRGDWDEGEEESVLVLKNGIWTEIPSEELTDEYDVARGVPSSPPNAEEAQNSQESIETGTFRPALLASLDLPADFELPEDYKLGQDIFGMLDLVQRLKNKPLQTLTEAEKLIFLYIGEMALEFMQGPVDFSAFLPPEPGDVRTTTLESLALTKGQTFLYLFDYGDEWRFKVRVHAINEDAPDDAEYPRVVQSVGQAPAQYGGWDGE